MSSNRAFTLLELLVVITIIGILSSIVIVSMSGSTDSATIAKGKAYAQQVHALLGHEAVGVWNFDEGTADTCPGSKDVCDYSGYGNHGTFAGNTHFVESDIEGYALSFDETGDYVDCGSNSILNIRNEITIEAWIKVTDTLPSHVNIVGQNSNGAAGSYAGLGARLWYYSGYDLLLTDSSANRLYVRSNITSINQWHHLVGTYDGTYAKIYVNAELKKTEEKINAIGISGGKTYINGTYVGAFKGLIDDVRIYTEALPSTEIQKHYVQGLERLLANQAITQTEYDQRMEEFNQSLVRHEE